MGLPTNILNAFDFLYSPSKCNISVKGGAFDGFEMRAGVRQGCPLSPLVYAIVAETILDKIEQCDGVFAQAYADDTVIITQCDDTFLHKPLHTWKLLLRSWKK